MTYDVLIVGAGPSGLCLSLGFAQLGLKVCIVEKQLQAAIADPQYDGREIALTHASHDLLMRLGLWQNIPAEHISRIDEARVVNADVKDFMTLADVSGEKLAFVVSNHLVRKTAYERVMNTEGIELVLGKDIQGIDLLEDVAHLIFKDGQKMQAKLIVAADSRFSEIRRMAGIATEMKDFGKTMVLCNMSHELEHNHIAHECFLYGKTLAVLPLNGKKSSVVYTVKPDVAKEVMALSDEDYAQRVTTDFSALWGKMHAVGKRYAYPLVATYAQRFYAQRLVLCGDAAVGMHPVTAHGFNFALSGQVTLIGLMQDALNRGADIGSSSLLQAYSEQHQRATKPLYMFTNGIVGLYTNDAPIPKLLRNFLVKAADKVSPVKYYITQKLMEKQAG